MFKGFLLFVVFFFLFESLTIAQIEKLTGDEFLEQLDYNSALREFLKEEKLKPRDENLIRKISVCYLNINNDRTKALPYLDKLYKSGKYDNEVLYDLGLVNMYDLKFDEAIEFFKKYKEKATAKHGGHELADRKIANCQNGKELIKNPINVTFENLGKEINTKYADYYPFVTKDESTLYFTSRREGNTGNLLGFQGYYTSDIYYSKVKAGVWTKAKGMGPNINTIEDEECVGITADGRNMVVYVENQTVFGDLFLTSSPKGKAFDKALSFEFPANTSDMEAEGCITSDLQTLFISSKRKGGTGEADIYMLKKLPGDNWSPAINLGPNINTPLNEAFPYLTDDGQTLYFASEGFNSMGGYDIFKSKWNAETNEWGPAVNMGYPINTPEDNMEFTLAGNGRDGYISAVRKGGLGDLDIYKVIFNDIESKATAFKGFVYTGDSLTKKPAVVTVTIINPKTNEEVDSKETNPKTGKFIFALEPGKYKLKINESGYTPIEEDITVLDLSDFAMDIKRSYFLKVPGAVTAPKNKVPVKKKTP